MCRSLTMDDTEKCEKVSSSVRRSNKPLMEKRRRQRINDCLGQLKTLVLQALKKDTTQYSKLEKADILEMTVKHLKSVQRQQMAAAMATDPNVISKYRAGFNECAAEVANYLDTVHGGSPDLKARVMGYLGNCMTQFPVLPVYQAQQMVPQQYVQLAQTGFMPRIPQATLHRHPSTGYSSQSEHAQQPQSPLDNLNHHIRMTSSFTSQSPSPPTRHVPSPSDSDSGLSDDSTSSLAQDENGNFSQYRVSNLNTSPHFVKAEQNNSPNAHRDNKRSFSQYSNDYLDIISHKHNLEKPACEIPSAKRRRVSASFETVDIKTEKVVTAPEVPVESDSMWRPW